MDPLEQEMLYFYRTAGRLQGVDDSLCTILGVLFLEPREIPMDELARKTGYSLASICNKIRIFEPAGLVKRIRKPGTKKVYLIAEKDVLKILRRGLILKQESVIKLAKERIPIILEKYKDKKLTQEQREKLKIIENYYKGMLKFEEIIKEILKKFDEAR
ncbi:hypothetical protein KY341_01950 [Candidatus Woesearchaeota archaeon]|nr:hypothetical protein [Candidatus Woesearchaeota archaeon]